MSDGKCIEWLDVSVEGKISRWRRVRSSVIWTQRVPAAHVVTWPPKQLLARGLGCSGFRAFLGLIELFSFRKYFSERVFTDHGVRVDGVKDCC